MHDLVIKGGRVALDDGWNACDIGIDGGRFTAFGANYGSAVLDATGLWVLPGGIDAHCHLDQPDWGGAGNADDFRSGSISAAFGGTTCMIPFGMPGPGMSSVEGVSRSLDRAAGAPSSTTACMRWRPWRRAPTSRSNSATVGAGDRIGQAVHDL